MEEFSRSQVDKLGKRLAEPGQTEPSDAAMYVEWSATFEDALVEVRGTVESAAERANVDVHELTGRIKQLYSVVAKLRREPRRLSTMDDIAGCRITVPKESEINALVLQLSTATVKRVRDYRDNPRNGYRAVHMTLKAKSGQSVELQIRTEIQHIWAGLSERRAATVGPEVKYGGGDAFERTTLETLSAMGRRLDLRLQAVDSQRVLLYDDSPRHIDESPPHELAEKLRREEERIEEAVDLFKSVCGTFAAMSGPLE